MPQLNGFLDLMDSRSFANIWFWLLLVGAWSRTGRGVLGVPMDVVVRARRDPGGDDGLALLNWLSLALPRWQLGQGEGAVMLGLAAFIITSLAVLGFGYNLEMAQALLLLGLPFVLVFVMRLRLARRLTPVLEAARLGDTTPQDAVTHALSRIRVHRWLVTGLSVLAVAVTALCAAWYAIANPYG